MGLTKSPAGVSWRVGLEELNAQETHIYTQRLMREWAADPRRIAILSEAGLDDKDREGALTVIALGAWQEVGDRLLAASGLPNYTIRDLARLNARTFKLARKIDLDWWVAFATGVVEKIFKDRPQPPSDAQ